MWKRIALLTVPLAIVAFILGTFVANANRTGDRAATPDESATDSGVVNIYTARHYGVETVFEEFTRQTGIEVRFTTGTDAVLRERLIAEGRYTPADLFIAVDAGNLWLAGQDGLLSPVESEVLEANIPEHLRDPGNQWFGLTQRVRTLMYHPDRVDPQDLSSVEALSEPVWKGRLAMRPATHAYTQSLVASLISAHGEEQARKVVAGWVANEPNLIDSDTRILETLAAGEGDVAITNHYYLGRMLESNPEFPVQIFWANQDDRGAHVNISGAGVTAYAPNRDNAVRLLEWLADNEGQKLFADSNHEFPANPDVEPHPIIAEFGDFVADPINMAEYGRLQAAAIKLMDEVGYR